MYQGRLVDEGTPESVRANPRHEHTRALFGSLLALDGPKRWASPLDVEAVPPVIELRAVSKTFRPFALLRLGIGHTALADVSLALAPGEKLGLVGGSGAGKSTIARLLTGMIRPDEGRVFYRGQDIAEFGPRARKVMSRAVHLVFQDPYQSLRNGMSILDIVAEPLRIHGENNAQAIEARVRAALAAVQLPSDGYFMSRRPVQLSGGQRQRVAFARAIVTQPSVIIADEPTSMLDQSVRMEIMDLMEDLRLRFGTAFLFITHDIALARHFCDRLIVLRDGRVVEQGDADAVIHASENDYTRRLIAAA